MRILHVTEASWGGTLSVVCDLAAELAAAGHEVAIAYAERPVTPPDLAARLPAAVEAIPLPWASRTPRAQLAAARALRALARERRPDVVHLHSSFAGAVGALALGGIPKVYTPHGYALARRGDGRAAQAAFRAVEMLVARRCAVVAAVSEAEAAIARTAVRAPRVEVVPNGIPELDPERRPAPAERSVPLVVAMGRVGPARRPAESARILGAVAGAATVRWIGDDPGDDAAPLAAAGVPVTGWLSREDARRELAQATVLLHYSAWDGAPLAVMEAMARDVVVVASDIPANRELLGPRQVCATEAEAIELVRAVLADAGLREALLAEQRERGAARGARRMAATYAGLYAGLAPSPGAASPVRTGGTPNILDQWS